MKKLNSVLMAFLIIALIFTPAISATLGYQIDMLLSQVRTAAGGAITNGHVHFYEAGGGTTNKTVWTTVNKTTPAANPYNLDSNGTAYVFGDGLYRIVIHSAPDTTSPLGVVTHGPTAYDWDNVRYEDFGTTMTRLTVITGDNTGDLSGFKNISGPGTGNVSGFDNATFTGKTTTAALTVTGTPTFTDNTVNGADLIDNTVTSAKILDNSITSSKILDNTIAIGKLGGSGTRDNTTFLRGDGEWTSPTTDNGTFTATLFGCSDNTAPSGAVKWSKFGSIVTMLIPSIQGTSDNTVAWLTGVPAALIPASSQYAAARTEDNTANTISIVGVLSTGVIQLWNGTSPPSIGFTASGSKGILISTITYSLD